VALFGIRPLGVSYDLALFAAVLVGLPGLLRVHECCETWGWTKSLQLLC